MSQITEELQRLLLLTTQVFAKKKGYISLLKSLDIIDRTSKVKVDSDIRTLLIKSTDTTEQKRTNLDVERGAPESARVCNLMNISFKTSEMNK